MKTKEHAKYMKCRMCGWLAKGLGFLGLKKIVSDVRGGVAIMLALGLVPTMLLGFGAIQINEYSTILTRVQQSQMHALYAAVKEGPDNIAVDGERQIKAWMDVNLEGIKRSNATYSHSSTLASDKATVTTDYSTTPLLAWLADKITGSVSQTTSATYYYQPIEIAIVVDMSPSYANYQSDVEAGIRAAANAAFLGEDSRDDTWISLVFAAGFVNIGTQYAEDLVNPASVVPYYDIETLTTLGTGYMTEMQKSMVEELAEETKQMLATYHPTYANNLMQPGAPGYDLDILCVAAKQLGSLFYNINLSVTEAEIQDYVEDIFEAPGSDSDRFDMVQGTAFPISGGGTTAIRLPKAGVLYATAAAGSFMTNSNSRASTCVGYEGSTLDQASLLNFDPEGDYYDTIVKTLNTPDLNADWQYWGTHTRLGGVYTTPMVTIPGGCPRPPMLIGAQDTDSLLERVALWGKATSSAPADGMTWALRAISPSYQSIWGLTDYPAEFKSDGGTREKRIIVMFDSDIATSGYANSSWGGADIVTPMCEAAEERGIDVYMMQAGTLSSSAEEIAAACAPDERRFDIGDSLSALDTYMAEACARKYRVMLTLE